METEAYDSSMGSVHTTRGDESFQVLNVILLLLILLLLDDFILFDGFAEGVVVTGVVRQLLLCQPNDVRAHTIQEVLQTMDNRLYLQRYCIPWTQTCCKQELQLHTMYKGCSSVCAGVLDLCCNHSPAGTFQEVLLDGSQR